MEHDAWFFIGIFAFIFIIWIATGGPLRTPAVNVPAVPEITSTGSSTLSASNNTTYMQLPRAPGVGDQNICLPGSTSCGSGYYNSGGSGVTGPATFPSGVPGVTFSPPSPYRNMVSMTNYVSNASSSNPQNEYVQISVAQDASEPVDITGWVLESGATGNAEIIPKGTVVPTSGVVNATTDIVLRPGDSAIIVSGESPVGASFRENKCIGYFSDFQVFTPPLPQNCPLASSELSSLYGTPYIHDPSCIDYTNGLSRCQTAITAQSANLSLTCQDFLENYINYNGCLNVHRNDPDFGGTTWRVYLGRKTPMWRTKYDVVELLDDRGKTVASFNY